MMNNEISFAEFALAVFGLTYLLRHTNGLGDVFLKFRMAMARSMMCLKVMMVKSWAAQSCPPMSMNHGTPSLLIVFGACQHGCQAC